MAFDIEAKKHLKDNGDGTFTIKNSGLKEIDKLRDFVGANTNYYAISEWDIIEAAKDILNKKQ